MFQRITDPSLKRCPTCQTKVTKLISNTSFHLKGSGWYVTDYGRKDSGAGKSKTSKDAGETKAESTTNESTSTGTKNEKSSKPTESAAA